MGLQKIKSSEKSLLFFKQRVTVRYPHSYEQKSEGTMKNKMIAWMAGVIAVVVALMVVIVVLEPEGEGITRAQAFKAAALLTASKEQCQSYEEESEGSHFSVKEQGNWFVKYMDYLYDEGYLTEELTPPTLAAAQGQLTYGEAAQIAEKVDRKLRTRVGATKNNQDKPYPQEQWWQMYMEMAGILDTEGKIQNITAVLYGTPSNLEGADSWTAYTTEGDFGFEGLALDAYLDCQIRFLARDGEMIAMLELVSRDAAYENVWIAQGEGSSFQAYLEGGYTDLPRIILILDGFSPFRELYGEEYEGTLQHICRDGLAYGITTIVTNTQTAGFGYRYLSLFGQRFAFSCNDTTEYSNIFPRCRLEPTTIRGRFLFRMEEVLEAQAFLAFQGQKEIDRARALKAFVERANERYPYQQAVPIPAIPRELTRDYIVSHFSPPQSRYACMVGLDYAEVDVVTFDLSSISELGVVGASPEKKSEVTRLLLGEMVASREKAPVILHIVDSVERPLRQYKDSPCVETYTIDFAEAGTIIDDVCQEMARRYDVLVQENLEALECYPLLAVVFNNRAVIDFISSNRDVLEKYRRIVKQAKSLKLLFIFSDLEAGSVPFSAPELMKSLKALKYAVITDNLKEVQLFDLPPVVVCSSKSLQQKDVFCLLDGSVLRTRMWEVTQ